MWDGEGLGKVDASAGFSRAFLALCGSLDCKHSEICGRSAPSVEETRFQSLWTRVSDVQVAAVVLPPMRVASVRVISETPERDAWEKMRAWAESKGLFSGPSASPVFGFNSPPPSEVRKEYGYEFWVRVDSEVEVAGELEAKDFPGGLYAVTRCKLHGDPEDNVLEVWKRLWDWVQSSDYEWRQTHELERLVDPLAPEEELVLDLYLPIEG